MLLKLLRGLFDRAGLSREDRLTLARKLQGAKQLSAAVEQYEALLAAGADNGLVQRGLANCLSLLGRAAEALPHYRRLAELEPNDPNAASSALGALNYDPRATPEAIVEAHRAWGNRALEEKAEDLLPARTPPGNRVRIGYVSPDFRRHPVTYLFAPTLERHDRGRFEIFCYDNLGKPDAVTERLKRASEHWLDVSALTDEGFGATVRRDGIDILVDLAGHTTHSRLRAFALKPAPIQVSWLGYFNTTGLSAIDYFVSDVHSSPAGQERWFVEDLVRLAHTRFCYEPPEFAPAVAKRPALAARVTFGCFNNLSKVNERVIALWARVLDATPGSRLTIVAVGLHDVDNVEHVRTRFAAHGVDRDRLELRPFLPHDQLLGAYGEVDIALDPFPFAGGLTSLEALWMGVPVVTLESPMLAGRQTLCFLRNVGLDGLVAADEDAYVAAAAALARDTQALAGLRASLRERMRASPLMDAAGFTRELEGAYEAMLSRQC